MGHLLNISAITEKPTQFEELAVRFHFGQAMPADGVGKSMEVNKLTHKVPDVVHAACAVQPGTGPTRCMTP